MPGTEQKTGDITQTSLSSRLHLQGGEAEKEGMQEHPSKPVTCWRKHWGKGLGDISLKSGHLSRGEPPQPLCTGEPAKSRAMLVDGGGLSRTWRMALSCREKAAAGGNRAQLGTV